MPYENILVETRGKVGLIRLNRPKALNALSPELMRELTQALTAFEGDESIGAMVITGSEKAFAAGADIKAMREWGYMDVYKADYITAEWETVARCRKPVIAAVAGYALGGGCELAGDRVTTTTWKELTVQFADGKFDAYSVRPKVGEPVALALRTPEGIEIGSTLEEVLDTYGDRVTIPGLPPEFQDPDSFAISFPGQERRILGGLTGGAVHSTVTTFFTQLCD